MKYSLNLQKDKKSFFRSKILYLFPVLLIVFIVLFFSGNGEEKKVVKPEKNIVKIEKKIPSKKIQEKKEKLKINSIRIERNSPSKVFFIIDEKIESYKVGEIVKNYEVLSIHRDFVILQDSLGTKKKLYLD